MAAQVFESRIVINAADQASKIFGEVGKAARELASHLDHTKHSIAAVKSVSAGWTRDLESGLKTLRNTGLVATALISAPIGLFAKASLNAAKAHVEALARLRGALRSTGREGEFSADQLGKAAENLSRVTKFDDTSILESEIALLKFDRVRGQVFKRAVDASADIAEALNQSAASVAETLGMALQAPEQSARKLKAFHIILSEEQRQRIAEMHIAGQTAQAQQVILDAVMKAYGGQAQEAAKTAFGIMKQTENAVDDVKKAFGLALHEVLVPFAERTRDAARLAQDFAETHTHMAGTMAAVAAAVGPAMSALGQFGLAVIGLRGALSGLIPIAVAAATAIRALGPIGWAISAAALTTALWTLSKGHKRAGDFAEAEQKQLEFLRRAMDNTRGASERLTQAEIDRQRQIGKDTLASEQTAYAGRLKDYSASVENEIRTAIGSRAKKYRGLPREALDAAKEFAAGKIEIEEFEARIVSLREKMAEGPARDFLQKFIDESLNPSYAALKELQEKIKQQKKLLEDLNKVKPREEKKEEPKKIPRPAPQWPEGKAPPNLPQQPPGPAPLPFGEAAPELEPLRQQIGLTYEGPAAPALEPLRQQIGLTYGGPAAPALEPLRQQVGLAYEGIHREMDALKTQMHLEASLPDTPFRAVVRALQALPPPLWQVQRELHDLTKQLERQKFGMPATGGGGEIPPTERGAPGGWSGGQGLPGRFRSHGGVQPGGRGSTVQTPAPRGSGGEGGSRSWRNNNPGNIEYGPFAREHGAIGSDGRFAIFPNEEAGRKAMEALLFESPSYRNRTLREAIERYAPSSENNVDAYMRALPQVDPNKRMHEFTPEERAAIIEGMKRHEGWREGRRKNTVPETAQPSPQAASWPNQITGTLEMGGEKYAFGSGGRRLPHIPFGDYPITPNAIGPWGARHGAIGINNNAIFDPALNRLRTGIEIHGATNDALTTAGCIAIAKGQWPQFRSHIGEMIAARRQLYLHVGQSGAKIDEFPRQIEESANASSRAVRGFAASMRELQPKNENAASTWPRMGRREMPQESPSPFGAIEGGGGWAGGSIGEFLNGTMLPAILSGGGIGKFLNGIMPPAIRSGGEMLREPAGFFARQAAQNDNHDLFAQMGMPIASQAQKVEIGKGLIELALQLPQNVGVKEVRPQSSGNFEFGGLTIDRTGGRFMRPSGFA